MLRLFAGPIRKSDSDVGRRQATVPAQHMVPQPARRLTQNKPPGQRQTSKKPSYRAIKKEHAVIDNIRSLQPKVAHSSNQLTFSARISQAKAAVSQPVWFARTPQIAPPNAKR